MKKLISLFIAIILLSNTVFASSASALEIRPDMAKRFTTVTGYIGGYTDGTVKPDNTITRAEMAQIIYDLIGRPEYTPEMSIDPVYEDVNEEYFYDNVHDTWYSEALFWLGHYHLFTIAQVMQTINYTSRFCYLVDEIVGIHDALRMDKFETGKYPVYDSPFMRSLTPEEYTKVHKALSWGLMKKQPDFVQEAWVDKSIYEWSTFVSHEWSNEMILELYPDGVAASELGDACFGNELETACWQACPMFLPAYDMTREEMALVLYRMTTKTYTSTDTVYSDVYSLSEESQTAISCLSNAGVISGYPDGTFGPEKTLTRAEAVVMINRFFGDMVVTNTKSTFKPTDLAGHWAEKEITRILK